MLPLKWSILGIFVHNGQYGQNGRYGMASYGHEYGWYWCVCKEQITLKKLEQKRASPWCTCNLTLHPFSVMSVQYF